MSCLAASQSCGRCPPRRARAVQLCARLWVERTHIPEAHEGARTFLNLGAGSFHRSFPAGIWTSCSAALASRSKHRRAASRSLSPRCRAIRAQVCHVQRVITGWRGDEPQETLLAYVDMVDACARARCPTLRPCLCASGPHRAKAPATNRSFEDSLEQCGGNMQSRAMIDAVVKLQIRHSADSSSLAQRQALRRRRLRDRQSHCARAHQRTVHLTGPSCARAS